MRVSEGAKARAGRNSSASKAATGAAGAAKNSGKPTLAERAKEIVTQELGQYDIALVESRDERLQRETPGITPDDLVARGLIFPIEEVWAGAYGVRPTIRAAKAAEFTLNKAKALLIEGLGVMALDMYVAAASHFIRLPDEASGLLRRAMPLEIEDRYDLGTLEQTIMNIMVVGAMTAQQADGIDVADKQATTDPPQ